MPPNTTTPRDLVFQVLSRWRDPSDPPFLPERSDPEWARLSPRDRPFAWDLLTGILRWRGALDAVLAGRLKQPIDTLDQGVRVALWLGAYQLLFQGTADYAAVDTAVTLARRTTPQAAGLVNAVLRGITRLEPRRVAVTEGAAGQGDQEKGRQGEAAGGAENAHVPAKGGTTNARLSRRVLALDFETDLRFRENVFPDPAKAPVAHLAAVRSHPAPFVTHLSKILPAHAADILLANNQRPLVTLRVDADELEIPATAGLIAHATEPRFVVAAEGWNDFIERRVESGVLSPQDPTSAKPVRHVATMVAQSLLPAPHRILDYCAGLGTKTLQLARAFPEAQVTATDLDPQKLARLEARMSPLKLDRIKTRPLADVVPANSGNPDLILLDVPCSNTGVFAKRVQSRWRWPKLDHAALAELQLKLLRQAAELLCPHGLLLYATCSLDPAENAARIQTFLAQNPSLTLLAEQATLPSLAVPPAARCDGGYFALLRRV